MITEVAPENTALYIGRFEPFHNGHLSVVKQIETAPDVEKILVGVGSSEASMEDCNPFNLAERKKMILESLRDLSKPFEIFGIPDKNDDEWWMRVVNEVAPQTYKILYTNNLHVVSLFEQAGIEVRRPNFEFDICGTDLRKMLGSGSDCWQDHVPAGTLQTILDVNGVDRIRSHFYKHPKPDVTADVILNCGDGVALIKRGGHEFHGYWAILGGFLDTHKETVPQAATRELLEEGHLDRRITYDDWFRQFSKPKRDRRGHVIANVFHIEANPEDLKPGDDAAEIRVFSWDEVVGLIREEKLAFDHDRILDKYMRKFKKGPYA